MTSQEIIDRAILELVPDFKCFYPIIPIFKDESSVHVVAEGEIPYETIDQYRFKWGVDEIKLVQIVEFEVLRAAIRYFLWGISASSECIACYSKKIELINSASHEGPHWKCLDCDSEWA